VTLGIDRYDSPHIALFIRVEKPAELAAWALRNNPGWSLERVQQQMQNGPDNVRIGP